MSSRLVSTLVLLAFAPTAVGLGACGGAPGTNAASQVLKTPELPTDKQAKCKVAKSQSEPLIVEWPDAARGRLESVSRRGMVAVRYEGCELSVLPRCSVKATKAYDYSPITRKQSKVVIKDADELYASMPVGAVKLEGKLQSAGQLNVQMTIVGRYESSLTNVYRDDLEGDCADATHVIAALTVGSFTFSAGSDAMVGGGASIGGAGAGGKSTAARETIQHDGDEEACNRSTISDKSPPEGCGALLQIEVMPLAKGTKKVAVVVPVPVPIPEPTPEPVLPAQKPTAQKPPPKCKKTEHLEDGVCMKGTKPAAKPKPAVASTTVVTCIGGQHVYNGHCVDDEAPPKEPPKVEPRPEPPPTCLAGSHLENGACVVDPYVPPPSPGLYSSGSAASEGQPNPWRTLLIYTSIGAGVAGTYLGISALANAGTAKQDCTTTGCSQEGADARDKAKTLAIFTDVAFGISALSLIGFFLLPSKLKVSVAPSAKGVAAAAWWNF